MHLWLASITLWPPIEAIPTIVSSEIQSIEASDLPTNMIRASQYFQMANFRYLTANLKSV
jgi:hypothetical protein